MGVWYAEEGGRRIVGYIHGGRGGGRKCLCIYKSCPGPGAQVFTFLGVRLELSTRLF